MPYLGTEVLGFSDILDFKSDILFFLAISAPETVFKKKKKGYHKKKRISLHISFDFLAQNTPIISAKRLPQTAKNGVQKKTLFLYSNFSKSEVSLVGYFGKKTCEIFFFAKNVPKKVCTLGNSEKKILIGDDFFA